jgi:hypothetical protein
MRYTVGWKPSAEQELARLWMNAPDRGAVESAANRIDALLGSDPDAYGESRSGRTRILIAPPLAVFYEVSEPDRFVDVMKVWRIH